MPPVAAADTCKTAHNKSPKTTKNSTETNTHTRLCHLVKRSDFDGYGFNLHSQKTKPGQYVGKIDANSPAEAAGLKEGDRIIEVNGLPVGKEGHKKVVQRIKAIAWEVKLLVINEGVIESAQNSPNTKKSNNAKENNEHKIKQDIKQLNTHTKPSTTTENGVSNSNLTSNNKTNNSTPAKNLVNSTSTTPKSTPTTPTTPPTPTTNAENLKQQAAGTLKLPNTAAEMRAILQSKKKYNAKSDDVNLQKKYDIIQTL